MKSCPVCGALLADQAASCSNCAAIKAGPPPARAAARKNAAWPETSWQWAAWAFVWLLRGVGYFLILMFAVIGVIGAASYSASAGYLTLCAILALATFLELRRPAPSLVGVFVFLLGFGGCGLVVIPKFSGLRQKSESHGNLGNLSSVRSAIQVYYGDNEGRFPTDLGILVPNYISSGLPTIKISEHRNSNAVQYLSGEDFRAGRFSDAGGWAYANSPADPGTWGNLVINCTHLRDTGAGYPSPWSTY